jgi:phage protein D/phage baseplate assembly protein gpV
LRVDIGTTGTQLFRGQITAVEHVYNDPLHDRIVYVRAYDALQQLRRRTRTRVHVDVGLGDLARELINGTGLTLDEPVTSPHWPYLIQDEQSDLALLVELAERCGLYLELHDHLLSFITLAGAGDPVKLRRGETLRTLSITINAERDCPAIVARGWNTAIAAMYEARVDVPRYQRNSIALADRWDYAGGEREIDNTTGLDEVHTTGLAQAELERQSGSLAVLSGVAEGDPQLRPGTIIQVEGIAEGLVGAYTLTSVTHLIDARDGYRTEINSRPPEPTPRRRGTATAPAIITQVDDPQQLGRVRAKLPTYGNIETDWLAVVTQAAGRGKGVIALPDVGDTVLLLLANEDPGQALVLGGLYSSDVHPPDSGIVAGEVRRFTFLTAGGQSVVLDEQESRVRIENGAGSYAEFLPKQLIVHAAADLVLEAPGHSITLRGKRIDFERG